MAKAKRGEKAPKTPSKAASKGRLGPGELDDLVLAEMREQRDDAPHTASRVGKRIGRSSGAVANCLGRLAGSDEVVMVSEKPREYDLPKGD